MQEIQTVEEMLHFTPVIAFPRLMIGDKLVCVGRFPTKDKTLAWLESEVEQVALG